jgi:ubiquinone/menaquinone biosynthesis C-methylase UbiE
MHTSDISQTDVQDWFNDTYRRFGLNYLRPVEAYLLFIELMQPKAGQKLLDVACGPGQMLTAAKPYQLDLFGVDISEVAVALCKDRLPEANVQTANAERLPFADDFFDFISCLGSIERFLNRKGALQEQYRVGKKGALYCFMVRNKNNFKWKFFKQLLGLKNKKGHQDALDLQQWRALFNEVGFVEVKVLPDHWPTMKWFHYFFKRLGFKVNYKKLPKGGTDIETTNEFIFLLRK